MGQDMKVLLEQLEQILEDDELIDEVGFVHPTQLEALYNDQNENFLSSSLEILESQHAIINDDIHLRPYDEKAFWHRNHKLAISTLVLFQLYSAALEAYSVSDKKYKTLINHSSTCSSKSLSVSTSDLEINYCENNVLRHSKALLILSPDFGSAWNSRKLVTLRSNNHVHFLNELQLSQLILSYSPKSDYAWTHRRWVIRMLSRNHPCFEEIIGKESELVKKIAERTKMNYRAWNHRGYLVSYMSRSQILEELSLSKSWAKLHVADGSCFQYRRRLMLGLLAGNFMIEHLFALWKEELAWNQSLIETHAGREALWMHRRFLIQWGLRQFTVNQQMLCHTQQCHRPASIYLAALVDQELQVLQRCLIVADDLFEDTRIQSQLAASYLLWVWKHTSHLGDDTQLKTMGKGYVQDMLKQFCPEKTFLYDLSNT